ncbi:MAG: thermonuclease family protein [Candidatus Omnitrophota bacterium]|nr:thermonuclease family protein [Candidatus Omnitrophota bacterium]
MRSTQLLLVLLSFNLIPNGYALAEQVVRVSEEGILVLGTDESVMLAGVQLSPETIRMLPALLAGKDVTVKRDDELSETDSFAATPVYLYIDANEINFPFEPGGKYKTTRMMINEWLLSIGAARVPRRYVFEKRNEFLKVQEEAKNRADGIWSYEEVWAEDV